jgi:hypothetical protein
MGRTEENKCMKMQNAYKEESMKRTVQKEKNEARWKRTIIRNQMYCFYVFVIPHSDFSFIMP